MKKFTTFLALFALMFTISCTKEFDELPERSFDEQLAIDIEFIDIYLEENTITALEHESGIRYVITEEGTGSSPAATDVVTVKYEGRFFSSVVFDSNDEGISFPLFQLIDAWKIMIPIMKEGGKMTVYAPSGYCYGMGGTSGIPPNASLIFDIELISIE
ncbi:MAG: FKBP-type peptidyl-prolyl cis-trans isomerase [Cyclobacteriaceae bacterium]